VGANEVWHPAIASHLQLSCLALCNRVSNYSIELIAGVPGTLLKQIESAGTMILPQQQCS
jgi:hypothetical protein